MRILVEHYVEMLHIYLNSTVVDICGSSLVQEDGVPMVSSIGPFLNGLYLDSCDTLVEECLRTSSDVRSFCYIDDFLVVHNNIDEEEEQSLLNKILHNFYSASKGLTYAVEQSKPDHICWQCNTRTKKGLHPHSSTHSRLVKRSIISTCFFVSTK